MIRTSPVVLLLSICTMMLASLLLSGTGMAAEPNEQHPPELVSISGQVVLPDAHPRVLYHNFLQSQSEHLHGMGVPQNHYRVYLPAMQHGEPEFNVMAHDVSGPSQPPMSRILDVRAVAVPPPASDGAAYLWSTPEGEIEIDSAVFEGSMDDTGRFHVAVPPYPYGYIISVTGDKVLLKSRVLTPVTAGQPVQNVPVDITTTLLADVSQALGQAGEGLSDSDIAGQLGNRLHEEAATMAAALHDPRFVRGGWQAAADRLAQSLTAAAAPISAASTYTTGDTPTFNLMSPAEITGATTTVTFETQYNGKYLGSQYYTYGVRFALYRPTYIAGETAYIKEVQRPTRCLAIILMRCRYFVEVEPNSAGGGISLNFKRDAFRYTGVKSVGMYIQNGTTHRDSSETFPRRPFRFTAFDYGGNAIMEYRWYTHQRQAGGTFYGITSNTPIYTVRVEVSDGNPFTIDDVTFSADYTDMSSTLGWRSDGNFTLTSDTANSYNHYNRMSHSIAARGADGIDGTADDDYSTNYTGGNHWSAEHTTTTATTSTLTAPAYTLSNFDMDPDDLSSFDVWAIGIDKSFIDPMTGSSLSDSDLAFCTIPANCTVMPWRSLGLHSASAASHWSHVHWQAYVDVESSAQYDTTYNADGSVRTGRWVEYSTDNGATWRNAWWWRDENHHGRNGDWWNNHMHPFMDSYMNGDTDGDGTIENADFDKDGSPDTNYDWDQGTTGTETGGCLDGDPDDCREWDTEFYMEYVDPPAGGTVLGNGNYDQPYIEGTSIVYRFRFITNGVTGTLKIDDVAFNNDDVNVGYYTDFEYFDDPNQ